MKRLVLTLAIAVTVLAMFAAYAGAFTMTEKIVVADQLIAISRVPAGGFTADQRIDHVNERLAYILGNEPLAPRYIKAVPVCGGMAIVVNNQLLVTVTPADARANNTTVAGLTRVWLRAARAALPQSRPHANIPG